MYNCTSLHIKGTNNVPPGLLRRWSTPLAVVESFEIRNFHHHPIRSLCSQQSMRSVQVQEQPERDLLTNLHLMDGVYRNTLCLKWIPNDVNDLQP